MKNLFLSFCIMCLGMKKFVYKLFQRRKHFNYHQKRITTIRKEIIPLQVINHHHRYHSKRTKILFPIQMNPQQQNQIQTLAKQNGWTLVGISGCTNSGKTTLCEKLVKAFPGTVFINQDQFFRDEDDPNHIWVPLDETRRHQNWELLECVNWDKMLEEIFTMLRKQAPQKPTLFLVEGHIIFNYKPLAKEFERKYYIRTDNKSMIYERRLTRNYVPADPPGYFDQYVWPMYLKNLEEIQDQTDIYYIDGSLDKETMFNLIYEDLKKIL